MIWKDYKVGLPYDGQYIISYSIDLCNQFPRMYGIIADRFDKEVWERKNTKDKCDYWIAFQNFFPIKGTLLI